MTSASPSSLATVAHDGALLGAWADAFEALCGAPVSFAALADDDPTAGRRIVFPRVFEPIELIGGTGHFGHRPALAAQVRRMGFDWQPDGRVLSVPAPGAFNARLATLGLPEAGFRLAYANANQDTMPLGAWLLRYMDGVITLLVNTPDYYQELVRSSRDPQRRDRGRWMLMSLAHDLSVHALNYQLVPQAAIADLAARIRAAVPERHAAWSQPAAAAPLTLTYFYDNDFNRYTYAVWCRCESPRNFAPLFLAERNYRQLCAALDVRLEETQAGIGDITSGEMNEMAPLAETSFRVE